METFKENLLGLQDFQLFYFLYSETSTRLGSLINNFFKDLSQISVLYLMIKLIILRIFAYLIFRKIYNSRFRKIPSQFFREYSKFLKIH